MGNILVRVILVALAFIGIYKTFPQIARPVDYYIQDPKFQSGVVLPAVNLANKALPDKLQIPAPAAVMGTSIDASISSPIKELTDEVSRQAANLAGEQINLIRKSATDAFCKTLIEKIKTECGDPGQP